MLGAQLRELRERAGLTQQQLATRAGLSWSTVAHIEQGRKPDLRVSTLVRLAGALGVPPTELFEVLVREGVQPRRDRGEGGTPPGKPERPGGRRGRPPPGGRAARPPEGREDQRPRGRQAGGGQGTEDRGRRGRRSKGG